MWLYTLVSKNQNQNLQVRKMENGRGIPLSFQKLEILWNASLKK